jgi:hypothetical protein
MEVSTKKEDRQKRKNSLSNKKGTDKRKERGIGQQSKKRKEDVNESTSSIRRLRRSF